MENASSVPPAPRALFTKKVGGSKIIPNSKRTRHGANCWAEVEGAAERIPLYFNAYLPEGTAWFDRWVTLEVLRSTPKPIIRYPGLYINFWLRQKIDAGRVVLVDPKPDKPQKTESVGHRPDPRLGLPASQSAYA